jgi:hypothetical protein
MRVGVGMVLGGGGRGGNGYGGGGKWAALLALLVVFPCLILQQGEEDGF